MSWERGIYVETWNVMAGEYSGNWLDSLVIPTVMAMAAILCLPRQFHVTVVENASIEDFHKARWLFPLYLVLVALFVLPLAIAGQTLLGESISSDAYVIALPKALGNYPLAVIAYLGGVSAAISMVIVATIALSNMISNEILMPLMLRQSRRHGQDFYRFSGLLLNVRRTTIVCLLMMAYVVYRMLDHSGSLAGIGQISFAAVAQLAPVLVGSLYFSESNSRAVMMGLLTGTLVWFFCLMVPVLAASGWVDEEVLLTGLFGLAWLKPEDLFMLGLTDSVTGTAFLALSLNILMYLLGCLYFQPDWEEKKQARTFVDAYLVEEQGYENINISVMDLRELAERFVGKGRVEAMMQRFGQEKGRPALDLWFRQQRAGPDLLSATERLLAGTMGASSARIV
ncbi:MAG: hybrid sensor histidine kinase/response regulator, partial [Endozoicomonas sp.]